MQAKNNVSYLHVLHYLIDNYPLQLMFAVIVVYIRCSSCALVAFSKIPANFIITDHNASAPLATIQTTKFITVITMQTLCFGVFIFIKERTCIYVSII